MSVEAFHHGAEVCLLRDLYLRSAGWAPARGRVGTTRVPAMNPALGLAAARVVIGGVALAAPDQGARLFRLDPVGNPQLTYMTRLFGAREVAIGAAALLARGRTRQALVMAGVAVDVADSAAGWRPARTAPWTAARRTCSPPPRWPR